jgi:hypothetical protein
MIYLASCRCSNSFTRLVLNICIPHKSVSWKIQLDNTTDIFVYAVLFIKNSNKKNAPSHPVKKSDLHRRNLLFFVDLNCCYH